MRLTCQPLADYPGNELPIFADGRQIAALWRERLIWHCQDVELRVTLLAAEAVVLPRNEPSEPATGAIARLNRAAAAVGGLLLLEQPEVFAERIALTAGVRLFAVTTDADAAVWDAALSLGQPVYGVRGTVACHGFRPDAYAVLSALAYGNFTAEDGLSFTRWDESTQGVSLATDRDVTATVVIRDGFEAASFTGREVRWQDRGNEGYVRLVVRDANGANCWTQPRFIAARSVAPSSVGGGCGS